MFARVRVDLDFQAAFIGQWIYNLMNKDDRNLVMVEIDGLSYHHVHKALEDCLLPTMQQMIEEDGQSCPSFI
jgi:hypothetical protein